MAENKSQPTHQHPKSHFGSQFASTRDDFYAASQRSRLRATAVRLRLTPLVALILAFLPFAVLIGLSKHVSTDLGSNGCLPNGDFALPYTSSVWNPDLFFTITIPFTKGSSHQRYCSDGGTSYPTPGTTQTCGGYGFTGVKIIDIVWDLIIGRGGQIFLALIAYRLFSRVLKSLMLGEEVGYDAVASVTFNTGNIRSLGAFCRHAIYGAPIPRSRRARLAFLAMILTTAYIIGLPTLFSAMTGYSSYYTPAMSIYAPYTESQFDNYGAYDCQGKLVPAWGKISEDGRKEDGYYFPTGIIDYENSMPGYIDYYYRYQHIYDQCAKYDNVSSCPAANIPSWLINEGALRKSPHDNETINAPLLDIVAYPNITGPLASVTQYSYWDCYGLPISTYNLTMFAGQSNKSKFHATVTGICQSGGGYVWGFSFLMMLIACISHAAFVLLMYWLYAFCCDESVWKNEVSQFENAVFMVAKAQEDYGYGISEWRASALERKILKGRKGIVMPQHDLGNREAGDKT